MAGPNKGKGKTAAWVMAHVNYEGDDCLPWPFSRDGFHGRGRLGHNGKMYWAHRLMCEMAHGPAPAGKPQVAHSCGKGHEGCVNPNHLSWKSNSENQLDRRRHGTQAGAKGNRPNLTAEQIAEIRSSRGITPQVRLAKKLGVSRGCVEYWLRTTHKPLPPRLHKSAS